MQMWCLGVSMLWCLLFVADLIAGMEELELQYRCRDRSNFRKSKLATISVRMVQFRRAWFQTPSSVRFLALTELRGENLVSPSHPIICVAKWTQQVFFFTKLTEFAIFPLSAPKSQRFFAICDCDAHRGPQRSRNFRDKKPQWCIAI